MSDIQLTQVSKTENVETDESSIIPYSAFDSYKQTPDQPDEPLELFTDEEIFPGFNFDDEYAGGKSGIGNDKDLIDGMYDPFPGRNQKSIDLDEQRILKKYTHHGILSTFKGQREMKKFLQKQWTKNNMVKIQSLIEETKISLNETSEQLRVCKEQEQKSVTDFKKIQNELEGMLQSRGLQSPFKSREFQSDIHIPKDSFLMVQSRFRVLQSHYFIHGQIILESRKKQPELESQIQLIREKLEKLQSEELKWKPIMDTIKVEEQEAFEELLVVSKYRNIDFTKKKASLFQKWKNELKKQNKKLELDRLKRNEMKKELSLNNIKMAEYFAETARKNNHEAEILALELKKQKKQQALESLKQHLVLIRQDLASKQSKISTSRNETGIQSVQNQILKEKASREKKLDLNRIKTEENRQKILDRVFTQETRQQNIEERLKTQNSGRKRAVLSSNRSTNNESVIEDSLINNSLVDSADDELNFTEIVRKAVEDTTPLPRSSHGRRKHAPVLKTLPKKAENNIEKLDIFGVNSPFIFDPPVIIFKDVVAGDEYHRSVKVINSLSVLNTFRLCQLPDDLIDCLTVNINHSGKICSGYHTIIQLKFTPNNDFLKSLKDYTIQFHSEVGGMFELPIKFETITHCPKITSVGGDDIDTIQFNHEVKLKSYNKLQPINCQLNNGNLNINFGNCLVGQTKHIWFTLNHEGSEIINYNIKPILADSEDANADTIFQNGFELTNAKGDLLPFSENVFNIYFKPKINESEYGLYSKDIIINEKFQVEFDGNLDPIIIDAQVKIKESILYVDRKELNFNWCIYDNLYQDRIVLNNIYQTGIKFHISMPKNLVKDIGFVSIEPAEGFIQPLTPFSVWVKLKISKKFYLKSHEGKVPINIPLSITYKDPSMNALRTIGVSIIANVTNNDIVLTSIEGDNTLNFDCTSLLEKKTKQFKIQNLSQSSQLVKLFTKSNVFVMLPSSSDIEADTFRLKPLESVTRSLCFYPVSEGNCHEQIICKNTWNRNFTLECYGIGVKPFAFFEKSFMQLDRIRFGRETTNRVTLKRSDMNDSNMEKTDIMFQFGSPIVLSIQSDKSVISTACDRVISKEGSWVRLDPEKSHDDIFPYSISGKDASLLQVWPDNGTLKENGVCNVDIVLSMPSSIIEAPKKEINVKPEVEIVPSVTKSKDKRDTSNKQKIAIKQDETIAAVSTPPTITPESLLSPFQKILLATPNPVITWLIPCILKPIPVQDDSLKKSLMEPNSRELTLDLKETAELSPIEKVSRNIFLQLRTPVIETDFILIEPATGKCDFEYVALGQVAYRTIVIKNVSSSPLHILPEGLNPLGPFEVTRAIRDIAPGANYVITIAFRPETAIIHSTQLELHGDTCPLKIRLYGKGVLPTIQIESGFHLAMGDVCVGDQVTQSVKICNPCPIPISTTFSLVSNTVANKNVTCNSFSISPFRTIIPAKGNFELNIKFTPDREYDNFYDYIKILFDGQDKEYLIKVTGHGWVATTCLLGYDPHPASYTSPLWFFSPKIEYDWMSQFMQDSDKRESSPSKREKEKDDNHDASLDILWATNRKQHMFVTYTLNWTQVAGSQLPTHPSLNPTEMYWRINSKEIILSNLKPLIKLETGKKLLNVEYTIEKFNGSFRYDEMIQDYVLCPADSQVNETGLEFALDPMRGSIEMGTIKPIKVDVISPLSEIWNQCYKYWDRLDKVEKPTQTIKSMSPGPPDQFISLVLDEDENLAQFMDERVKSSEIKSPKNLESVFKITFRNSYRLVDPKGQLSQTDKRIFYLKLKAEVPNSATTA
ncbi:hypothetical protein BC833DRAFT_623900 [Globomyces pollinis-pini]|nr:hypothetical protein BC833DRAFT_623900 [Globomyces pollinis-pini]